MDYLRQWTGAPLSILFCLYPIQGMLLDLQQLPDNLLGQREQGIYGLLTEGLALGGTLDLNKLTLAGHDDIKINPRIIIFIIAQV